MGICTHSPLRIQLHQLAHVEAELDVGDGAAGISLAAGTRAQWHREPGDRHSPCHPPASRPARLRHTATHWKCLMIREGSVISLGMWVTISVRATWGRRAERAAGQGVFGTSRCRPAHPLTGRAEARWGTDCHPAGWPALTASMPAPRPRQGCHLPDGRTVELQSQETRQQERKICLQAARLSPEAGENQCYLSLPAQSQAVSKALPGQDHPFCKAQSCPLTLIKAGLEEGRLLTFSFSLYSRWTEW